MARIVSPTHDHIAEAARLLKAGEVVAIPTETVYGLAGVAFDEAALTKIFKSKERPTFDPLILHVPASAKGLTKLATLGLIDLEALSPLAAARAEKLIERFWPGPLTLVLTKSPKVPDLATSGLNTVAIRMPAHPVAQSLIEAVGAPLAAPSANRFGRISPTCANDVLEELGDRISLILDGGPCNIGVESTVVHIATDGTITQLRPGGVPLSEIEAATNTSAIDVTKASTPQTSAPGAALPLHGAASPGMLESHYAPKKKLILLNKPIEDLTLADALEIRKHVPQSVGVLATQAPAENVRRILEGLGLIVDTVQTLCDSHSGSPTGSPTGSYDASDAARRLFSCLRELDRCPDSVVLLAEPWPDHDGLGHAICDRLHRASAVRL